MFKYRYVMVFLFLSFCTGAVFASNDLNTDFKVRVFKTGFVVEDSQGKKIFEKYYYEKPLAVFYRKKYIYVFWPSGKIEVSKLIGEGKKIKFVEEKMLGRKIVKVHKHGDNFLIVSEEHPISTYILKKNTLKPWKKGVSGNILGNVSGSKKNIAGRVVNVRKGKIIFNKGAEDGLEAGDHLKIKTVSFNPYYDAIADKMLTRPSSKIVAVVTVKKVYPHKSVSEIPLGAEIKAGDHFVFVPSDYKFPLDKYRKWKLSSLSADIYPGFLLGEVSLAGNFRFDYHGDILHVSLGTHIFGGSAASNVFNEDSDVPDFISSTVFMLRTGVEGDVFEIGLGMEYVMYYQEYGQSDITSVFSSYIRFGHLDGKNVKLGIRASSEQINGFWFGLQMPWSDKSTVYFDLDVLFNTYKTYKLMDNERKIFDTNYLYWSCFLGDKIRLWGSGGKETLYVPLFIGYQSLELDTSNFYELSIGSFIIGAGLEYRF